MSQRVMKAQLLSTQTQADLNSQRGVNGIRAVTRKVNLGQNSLTYNLQQSHTFRTDIRNKRFRRTQLNSLFGQKRYRRFKDRL